MKNTLKLMTTILMLVSSIVVFAQDGARDQKAMRKDGKGMKKEGAMMKRDSAFAKISARLQLSPDQQTQLKEIMKRNRQEMKAVNDANKDADKATRRQAKIAQMKKADEEIKAILTDTQRAEYDKIKEEKKAQMRKKMEKRRKAKGKGQSSVPTEDMMDEELL